MFEKTRWLSLVGLVVLMGCATSTLGEREFGPPPPSNHQRMIQNEIRESWTNKIFRTNDNASYVFMTPFAGQTPDHWVYGIDKKFGWLVCGSFLRNGAADSYAPDDVRVPFLFLFREGKIVESLIGSEDSDHLASPVPNRIIRETCVVRS